MFFFNIQDRLLESKHEVGEKRWWTVTKSVQNPVLKTSRNNFFFNPVSNLGNREWLTIRPTKCQQTEEKKTLLILLKFSSFVWNLWTKKSNRKQSKLIISVDDLFDSDDLIAFVIVTLFVRARDLTFKYFVLFFRSKFFCYNVFNKEHLNNCFLTIKNVLKRDFFLSEIAKIWNITWSFL